MYSNFLVLAVCLASAACDRFQDYNKFPNRRYGEPTSGGYEYERRNDPLSYGGRSPYDGRGSYGTGSSGYGAGSGSYGAAGGSYGVGSGGYGTGASTYGTAGSSYGGGGNSYGAGGSAYGTAGSSYGTGYDGRSGYDEYGGDGRRDYCRNRSAQTDIEMEQLMGMWYGVEIIPHLVGNPGTYADDVCVVLHIAEITDEPSTESGLYYRTVLQERWWRTYRHLRLVWDEAGRDVEYSLYFKNDSVGFWNSQGDQNGTLPAYRSYRPFTGTVQVLKAVGDHLLLHFCQAATDGQQAQLFSVLLSREPRRLQRWEVESAHALLRRKGLSVTTRRLVCGNSAAAHIPSLLTATALLAFALRCSL